VYPGTQQLLQYWKNIYRKHGKVHIEIAGGEPLTYPDFAVFVRELSQMHDIGVTSNLSGDIAGILECPTRFNIGMSFHPLFADLDTFITKAAALKEKGFGKTVLYVAYPPQIEQIPFFKKKFEEKGLLFSVLTFWGKYEGRDYPQSYTEREKHIIDTALGVRGESQVKYQIKPVTTRGKACRAGQTYALVHPNGDAYRCGGGNWKEQHQPFANVFNDDFSLFSGPQPCESDQCPCNEWTFLLVEDWI
jgi:MoaA/NifB/PqqE/SkfB family radical SAM enzyme